MPRRNRNANGRRFPHEGGETGPPSCGCPTTWHLANDRRGAKAEAQPMKLIWEASPRRGSPAVATRRRNGRMEWAYFVPDDEPEQAPARPRARTRVRRHG